MRDNITRRSSTPFVLNSVISNDHSIAASSLYLFHVPYQAPLYALYSASVPCLSCTVRVLSSFPFMHIARGMLVSFRSYSRLLELCMSISTISTHERISAQKRTCVIVTFCRYLFVRNFGSLELGAWSLSLNLHRSLWSFTTYLGGKTVSAPAFYKQAWQPVMTRRV